MHDPKTPGKLWMPHLTLPAPAISRQFILKVISFFWSFSNSLFVKKFQSDSIPWSQNSGLKKIRMHLLQYSTAKSNITVTNLEQRLSTERGGKQTAPPMPEKFHAIRQCCLYILCFSFFFTFKRIKTTLNKNCDCERSHAFATYMPHFYSSNASLDIREKETGFS